MNMQRARLVTATFVALGLAGVGCREVTDFDRFHPAEEDGAVPRQWFGDGSVGRADGQAAMDAGTIDACAPVSESCDGEDDDCDGMLDEGFMLDADPLNCGSCGHVCPTGPHATPVCAAGACSLACDDGFYDCDAEAATGCEADLGSIATCGACDRSCSAPTGLCGTSGGSPACVSSCTAPAPTLCGTSCVDTTMSLTHCGACGHACADAPHANDSCAAGMCAYSCETGYADCDRAAANGCETGTTHDVMNCGGCAMACAPANAVPLCEMGRCGIGTCRTGFGNCDGTMPNGCETPLTTLTSCGACGFPCSRTNATPTCATGLCTISSCAAGWGDCDRVDATGCETSLTSTTNCGACGSLCSRANATSTCSTGSCSIVGCNGGYGNCDSNDANGCETALTSLTSCGACGRACDLANATESCDSGSCTFVACNAGFRNCDGNTANGCEPLVMLFRDADADGYGAGTAVPVCPGAIGYVSNATDCNDASPAIRPGATETCNGVDDDCDAMIDEGCRSLVFVSSGTYAASLGGVGGADAECQRLAMAAGLSGTFHAILSSSTANAADRLVITGAIYDVGGNLVAANEADLWDGAILRPINMTEVRVAVASSYVWTGTDATGLKDDMPSLTTPWCSDWTGTLGTVEVGMTDFADARWVAIHAAGTPSLHPCTSMNRLYCIQS